jgi:hypothetical protein
LERHFSLYLVSFRSASTAQRDLEFAALAADDIRRVVYEANRANRDPHDALVEVGHIVPLAELIEL